jgi:murein DD-endopeptidase MepM/ murein hydrolase activator NlpD
VRRLHCFFFFFSLVLTPCLSSAESYKEYTVGSGETLYSIAKKHNMTLVEIIKLNDIKPEESMVKFGQKIKVSSSGGVESHKSIEESKSSGNGMVEKEHIVGADETLSSISKQYNLKMKSILDLNNLGVDAKLKFGQKIKVLVEDDVSREEVHAKSDAKKEPYHVSKNCHGEYAVKAGDTLLGIKNKLEVNLNEMLEENNLTLNSKMKIGQKIKYKKSNCESQNDDKKEKSAEKKVVAPVRKSVDKDVSENEDDDEKMNIGSGSSASVVVPTPSAIPSASKSTKSKAKVDDSEEDVVPQVVKKTSKSDFIYPVSYSSIKNEHDGMVFNVKSKETVKSSSRGKVVYIGNDIKAIATLVMVSSEDGYVVLYGNMGSIKVKNGQSINQGDVIGNADGSKAYFAIRKNGKFVNPESVLDK